MFARHILFSGVLAALLSLGAAAQAQETLLKISGALDDPAPVSFSDTDLAALPSVEFVTGTIWTEGVSTFSGPPLKSVLEAAGAGRGDLLLVAANDYKVSLPRDVIEDDYPIIANRIDGKAFGIRDKGPLWLVFPYDAEPRFQSELIYSYSIWQLTQIEVLEE
jgi:hypothetical protein